MLPGKQKLMRTLQFGRKYSKINHNSEFRPSVNQKRIPGYTSLANKGLYELGWNPYQSNPRTKKQKQIAKSTKDISTKFYNNVSRVVNYGNYPNLQQLSGPNTVAYRNPYLMYNGAGGNTLSFLRGVDYLPSGKKLSKVKANNNPTGYLAKAIPISKASSGKKVKKRVKKKTTSKKKVQQSNYGKWSNPDEPWVMKNTERPFTTELVHANTASSTGPSRLGQPLNLYTYQNTPIGGKQYPASMSPRMWYGGFGIKNKSKTKKKTKKIKSTKRVNIDNIDGGDTVVISKGVIKQIKKSKK
jgi:hypothetical protein